MTSPLTPPFRVGDSVKFSMDHLDQVRTFYGTDERTYASSWRGRVVSCGSVLVTTQTEGEPLEENTYETWQLTDASE